MSFMRRCVCSATVLFMGVTGVAIAQDAAPKSTAAAPAVQAAPAAAETPQPPPQPEPISDPAAEKAKKAAQLKAKTAALLNTQRELHKSITAREQALIKENPEAKAGLGKVDQEVAGLLSQAAELQKKVAELRQQANDLRQKGPRKVYSDADPALSELYKQADLVGEEIQKTRVEEWRLRRGGNASAADYRNRLLKMRQNRTTTRKPPTRPGVNTPAATPQPAAPAKEEK